jgi:hypothetical protein
MKNNIPCKNCKHYIDQEWEGTEWKQCELQGLDWKYETCPFRADNTMKNNQQDKYKELWEKEYNSDDILKILCALTTKNTNTANITETIYGSGLKFTVNMKAEPFNPKNKKEK